MPDQDRAFDAEVGEQRREHIERLAGQVVGPAGAVEAVRLAVAAPRVRAPGAEPPRRLVRKVAPERDRSQPLVQEHQPRLARVAGDEPVLEVHAEDGNEGHGLSQC